MIGPAEMLACALGAFTFAAFVGLAIRRASRRW